MPLWQDDEEPQWGVDEPEVTPAAAPAAAGKEGEAPAADGAAPAGDQPPPAEEDAETAELRKYYKHWVRPKFLQYSYLYDYRKNYYDDVIDYLDRRSHGLNREIPRPQTWAERVLRTYNQKLGVTATSLKVRGWVPEMELRLLMSRYYKTKTDEQLIHSLHHTRQISSHHTKNYYHKVFTIAY